MQGENFNELLKVKSAGNSNTKISYQDYDKRPLKGTSYYRLRQTDIDGHYTYSKIVVININKHPGYTIFPNPVNRELIIDLAHVPHQDIIVKISDAKGAIVFTETFSNHAMQYVIRTSDLPSGIYIVQLTTEEGVINEKIVKH